MTEFVHLGDVIESAQSGFASGERSADGVVQLRMNNVTTDGSLDWSNFIRVPATEKEISRYALVPGDVLFNATNSPNLVGKAALFDGHTEKVVFSNHFVRLRADVSRLEARYLARWLTHQWQRKTFESLCTQWVNQATVRKEDLLLLKIPLPPLPEQRRIAARLDKADHLRHTRRYAAQLSDTFLQAVFVRMFGDPVRNPMGWDVVELAETFSQKPQIGSAVPAQETGEQIVIRVGEIGENRDVSLGRCKRLTLEGKDLDRFRVIPGDFLLARAIGSEEHLGKASILQPTNEVVVYDSHVMRLRFKQNVIHPIFFLEWLKSAGGRNRFMQRAGRTAVQFNVNTDQISEVAIPIPPSNLQLEFVKVANQHKRLRAQQREAERQAEHLFQTLLHSAFGGEG